MIKKITVLFFILGLFTRCGKESNYIANVAVNYNVTIQEFKIKAVNNVLIVQGVGVAGILVVYNPFNGAYMAYDRCSSVNPEAMCKVNPDDGGLSATDPCTGAKFSLLDGSPSKAPAVRNLKSYDVSLQGGQLLHISN